MQDRVDPTGRLRRFALSPVQQGFDRPAADELAATRAPPLDDDKVFALAGLDIAAFDKVPPMLVPDAFADQRSAWRERKAAATRVAIARYAGYLVAFERLDAARPAAAPARSGPSALFIARALLLIIAAGLAWHALWRRQADSAGAVRIGLMVFALVALFTVLTGDHGGTWGGVGSLLLQGMSHGLGVATELLIYYRALEPHARRIWPRSMTSWSRLLAGRWRSAGGRVGAGRRVRLLPHVAAASRAAAHRAHVRPAGAEPGGRPRRQALAGVGPTLGVFCEIVVDVVRPR